MIKHAILSTFIAMTLAFPAHATGVSKTQVQASSTAETLKPVTGDEGKIARELPGLLHQAFPAGMVETVQGATARSSTSRSRANTSQRRAKRDSQRDYLDRRRRTPGK